MREPKYYIYERKLHDVVGTSVDIDSIYKISFESMSYPAIAYFSNEKNKVIIHLFDSENERGEFIIGMLELLKNCYGIKFEKEIQEIYLKKNYE